MYTNLGRLLTNFWFFGADLTKTDEGQNSYIKYIVKNINYGAAEVVFENYNSVFYATCVQNSQQIFEFSFFNVMSVNKYIYGCLQLQDSNGDFMFSRSSTHKVDYSESTISLSYRGLVPMSNLQTNPEPKKVMLRQDSRTNSIFGPNKR